MNDVILNKKESIERCLKQIRQYYQRPSEVEFVEDHLKQDAIAINMQRACEQSIDLANHLVKTLQLGIPKDSRDSFQLLADHHIVPGDLAANLIKMIGFRNILVHEYQQLDLELMVDIIENHLDDLLLLTQHALQAGAPCGSQRQKGHQGEEVGASRSVKKETSGRFLNDE
jgi:uncharacterized protein YutE (UPF0331/DUF86 family)